MNILKVSTINFCSNKSAILKKASKNVRKDMVDYSCSAYSVPTGEFPLKHLKAKSYTYLPYDKNIAKESVNIKKEIIDSEQEILDFVSESSIL